MHPRLSQMIAVGLLFFVSACSDGTPASPAAPALHDYSGVWDGLINITSCMEVDAPGLIPLGLCGGLHRTIGYRLTLAQIGTSVFGTHVLTSAYFDCACGVLVNGVFGSGDASGVIAPDGTLTITSLANIRFTGGVSVLETFTLTQSSASTITGTVSGHLRFNTPDDRSVFAGVVTSGSR